MEFFLSIIVHTQFEGVGNSIEIDEIKIAW